MTQKALPNPDIGSAIHQLDLLMNNLKHNKYVMQDIPVSKVPKTPGTKDAPALKKREQKQEAKHTAVIERKSTRLAANPKPVYDLDEIF